MLPFILVLSNCGFLGTIALWQRNRRGWRYKKISDVLETDRKGNLGNVKPEQTSKTQIIGSAHLCQTPTGRLIFPKQLTKQKNLLSPIKNLINSGLFLLFWWKSFAEFQRKKNPAKFIAVRVFVGLYCHRTESGAPRPAQRRKVQRNSEWKPTSKCFPCLRWLLTTDLSNRMNREVILGLSFL